MVFAYGLQLAKNFQLIDDSTGKTLTLLPCGGWKVSVHELHLLHVLMVEKCMIELYVRLNYSASYTFEKM